MRSTTPFARSLALLASTAVITVAAGTAAGAAPTAAVRKLVAALHVSTTTPQAGSPLQVDVRGTKLPKGDKVKSITITFGDKTKAVHLKTLKGSTKHAFAKAGTYTVTVTIVDKNNTRSVKARKVTVKAKPTTATTTTTSHTFPITVPATATPQTLLGSLLTADQVSAVATQLVTPANLIPYLPVGYLGLLPASELSLPPNGLPRLPGLVGLNLGIDVVSQLPNLTGLPINLPTSGVTLSTPLSSVPLISFAQLGTLGALFGEPSILIGQLPLVSLALLPASLLHAGLPSKAGLPITIPSGLLPTDTVQHLIDLLGLSSSVVNEIASLLSTPPSVLPQLPVAYLDLMRQIDPTTIVNANKLPKLPGLASVDLTGSLVQQLLNLVTAGLTGFPLALPANLNATQKLGSLPTNALTSGQTSSLATIFAVPAGTIAQLPVQALHLLPDDLFGTASTAGGGGSGGGGGTVTVPTLPLPIPPGLNPTDTVAMVLAELAVPGSMVDQLAAGLGVPAAVFEQLPVGALKGLSPSLVSLPVDLPKLPALVGLDLGAVKSVLTTALGLLGIGDPTLTIPSDFDVTKAVGLLPAAADPAATMTAIGKVLNVSPAVVSQLPVGLFQNAAIWPASLVATGGTVSSYVTGLPATLTGTILPTTKVKDVAGLSANALSSIASLTGIPAGTLGDLPAGFLKLVPAGNLSGSALPDLPGLGSLPLVGNLLGMVLAGLPIAIPAGTPASTLIGALPSPLKLVQLTTLSTFFGISTTTLSSLPVKVLTLLPAGYVTGL